MSKPFCEALIDMIINVYLISATKVAEIKQSLVIMLVTRDQYIKLTAKLKAV